ncbi:MAG: hypothetical protein ACOY71_10135 [Gemmatimonadota bacterium]
MRQPQLIHALVPLSLFEALKNIDTPVDDGLNDVAPEIVAKRLGLSPTVAAQIDRFRDAAREGGAAPVDEVVSIFRLVARRPDAALVFADAGRRAARYAARAGGFSVRAILTASPGGIRRRLGLRSARRVAAKFLAADLRSRHGLAEVKVPAPLSLEAAPDGKACAFYGAAFGELLRLMAGFEGVMVHAQCRGRGGAVCEWRAAKAEGYDA